MAWRIHDQVIRGELDNSVRGKVTGTVWLLNQSKPIQLTLLGDPWRDWAGCRLTFTNPHPKPGDLEGFALEQNGVCGDMTASRKVRIVPEPLREWLERGAPGKDSLPWGNAIYLEWFSERNGRVVIASAKFDVQLSQPAWCMTEAEERKQRERNSEAMMDFMGPMQTALAAQSHPQPAAEARPDPTGDCDAAPPEAEPRDDLRSRIEDLKHRARQLAGGRMIEAHVAP